MKRFRIRFAFVFLVAFAGLAGRSLSAVDTTGPEILFSDALIPPFAVTSDDHLSATRNGVRFDVHFNRGPKHAVAIYAINTGRKQLALTPEQHRAILEDLITRKFTVMVADFRDKDLHGPDLEKYIVQLTADAKEVADGVSPPAVPPAAPAKTARSKTETYASNYYTLMPGFTVETGVAWFRYGDVPEAFRNAIARQLGKPVQAADAEITNTYDIIHPVHGPAVGVLTNYGSDEKGHEPYYPRDTSFLVMAFAFKNLAIVHQQYFNDPVGGYPKGYEYYGDQFATCFIRHLKGQAATYHLDVQRICCFGHSKGSQIPGMLINRLRGAAPYLHAKADWKKLDLGEKDLLIPSAHPDLSTEIAGAILGAGIANRELASEQLNPWANDPVKHLSPFFLYADHRQDTRQWTMNTIAKATAHGIAVETAVLDAHTWPIGAAYDAASAFIDRLLRLDY